MNTWHLHSTGPDEWVITAHIAHGFFAHLIGLLGSHSPPKPGCGLMLTTRSALHTFGMRFPIDIVYFDEQLQVIACRCRVPPWRLVRTPRGTRFCLEMMAGASQRIRPGTRFTRESLCAA
ncbi:MAG: DUF192 domain-containing protein [Spiribacter sp.]|nr:DUF192 domain-containing protein [Spiribacter sp.]